ncbi:hypothetical protein HDU96_004173 [Phlyctochytrium bullatum]|nr:hypothetical protein HDU96_004173 [Phlyctochytrium bullatum]
MVATSVYCVRSHSPKRLSVGPHAPAQEIDVKTTGARMNARKRISISSNHSQDGHSMHSNESVVSFIDPATVGPRGVHHHPHH